LGAGHADLSAGVLLGVSSPAQVDAEVAVNVLYQAGAVKAAWRGPAPNVRHAQEGQSV